jgi:hypothetical protein
MRALAPIIGVVLVVYLIIELAPSVLPLRPRDVRPDPVGDSYQHHFTRALIALYCRSSPDDRGAYESLSAALG